FVSIVVEIGGIDAHARFRFAQLVYRRTRQQRGFLERAVALIDPQQILDAVVGDVNVDPAVAVEVGGRYAERWAEGSAGERCGAHVDELAVPDISVQPIRLD